MEAVKDSEFYKGLAKAIETYMKYGSPGYDPFVLRMSHLCAESLQRLLEKQEPLVMHKHGFTATCPECQKTWMMWEPDYMRYCPYCGKAMKWDDDINLS